MPKRRPPQPPSAPERPSPTGEGPRTLQQGSGKAAMSKTFPLYTLTLDAGGFEWLWGIVEAKLARSDSYEAWLPEYRDMVVRATQAFRDARSGRHQEIAQAVAPVAKGRTVSRTPPPKKKPVRG